MVSCVIVGISANLAVNLIRSPRTHNSDTGILANIAVCNQPIPSIARQLCIWPTAESFQGLA